VTAPDILDDQIAYYPARAGEYDEWWFRTGRYDRGADFNAQWPAETAAVEAALTPDVLDGYLASLTSQQLEFTMPKFEFKTRSALAEPLKELGLEVAFDERADFSGMTGDRSLIITGVTHESVIKVTEEGTEAAGATSVEFGTTSVPQTRPVHVDRPFLFAIRDHATGAVLFLGRVVDPR
jgi:serpin B